MLLFFFDDKWVYELFFCGYFRYLVVGSEVRVMVVGGNWFCDVEVEGVVVLM